MARDSLRGDPSHVMDKSLWPRVKFGDVVRLNTDRIADPVAEGVERYVGIEHIEPEDLRIRSWGLVAEGTTFTNHFRPGQVLFVKRRAYQRKVAVADFEGVCSGDIYVLESKDPTLLLPELLPFLCQTDGFLNHAVGTSAGSLSPRTNWTQLAGYEFPLPPLTEQRWIADTLKASETVHYMLREASDATTLLYASLSNSVFARYGIGQWPQPNATAEWKPCRLGDITRHDSPICYGIVQVGDNVENGVPTVAIKNLGGDFETGVHRSADSIEVRYERSRVREGDVLISIKGTIGQIDIVPRGFKGNISRDIARIRLKTELVSERFFVHLWKSPPFKRHVRSLIVGTTRAELSISTLRNIVIPVPSHDLQEMVSMELEAIEQTESRLRNRLVAALAVHRQLLETLLH